MTTEFISEAAALAALNEALGAQSEVDQLRARVERLKRLNTEQRRRIEWLTHRINELKESR